MHRDSPEASVIVPHHGDPALALALLADLRAQEDVALEIIVVDDASPRPFPGEVEGARVLRRVRNGGFGAAANTGARSARAPSLLILNSDLRVPRRFARELLDAAAPWGRALAGPRLDDAAGRPQPSARRFPSAGQQLVEWLTPLARFRDRAWWHRAVGHELAPARIAELAAPIAVDWVVGAAMLLPRELLLELGGFDEGFHMNCEEVDLQRRLAGLAVPRILVPGVRARHEGGASSPGARRRAWLVAARVRYARRWHGGAAATRLRALLALASLANLAANCLRRGLGSPVRPLATLWLELGLLRAAGRPGPLGAAA